MYSIRYARKPLQTGADKYLYVARPSSCCVYNRPDRITRLVFMQRKQVTISRSTTLFNCFYRLITIKTRHSVLRGKEKYNKKLRSGEKTD